MAWRADWAGSEVCACACVFGGGGLLSQHRTVPPTCVASGLMLLNGITSTDWDCDNTELEVTADRHGLDKMRWICDESVTGGWFSASVRIKERGWSVTKWDFTNIINTLQKELPQWNMDRVTSSYTVPSMLKSTKAPVFCSKHTGSTQSKTYMWQASFRVQLILIDFILYVSLFISWSLHHIFPFFHFAEGQHKMLCGVDCKEMSPIHL